MMTVLGYIFLYLVIFPLLAIWRAYVFVTLWAWFIVAHFGAQPLRIPIALGIVYIVALLWERLQRKDDRPAAEIALTAFLQGVISPLLTLGFGWIVAQFV